MNQESIIRKCIMTVKSIKLQIQTDSRSVDNHGDSNRAWFLISSIYYEINVINHKIAMIRDT